MAEEEEAVSLLITLSEMKGGVSEDVAATQVPVGTEDPADPMSGDDKDEDDSTNWSDMD